MRNGSMRTAASSGVVWDLRRISTPGARIKRARPRRGRVDGAACGGGDTLSAVSRTLLVLREPEIRRLLDPAACLLAVEQAFTAYATGGAELPAVINLNVPE